MTFVPRSKRSNHLPRVDNTLSDIAQTSVDFPICDRQPLEVVEARDTNVLGIQVPKHGDSSSGVFDNPVKLFGQFRSIHFDGIAT